MQNENMARPREFVNSVGMKMIFLPVGRYVAGIVPTPENQKWFEWADETPKAVQIASPFFMAEYPVTNGQYRLFMRETGRPEPTGLLLRDTGMVQDFRPLRDEEWNGDDQPVVCVTLEDMKAFCRWLNGREGERSYRLPSREEWEYACRAGTRAAYNWGTDEISRDKANYNAAIQEDVCGVSFSGKTTPVGAYSPNAWGLHDMHGNVNEATATLDPSGGFCTVRGGSWLDTARRCRSSSNRNRWNHVLGLASIGFRLACEYETTAKIRVSFQSPARVKAGNEDPEPKAETGASKAWDSVLQWHAGDLLLLQSGKLICDDRCSVDGGKTWRRCAPLASYAQGTSVQKRDGTVLVLGKTRRTPEEGPGMGRLKVTISRDDWETVEQLDARICVPTVIGGFDDLGVYHDRVGTPTQTVIEMPDGTLLCTMNGFLAENRGVLSDYQRYPMEYQPWKCSAWIMRSDDGGMSWNYLSTMFSAPELTRGGYAEPALTLCLNGDLLAAARTGEHSHPNEPLLFARSSDGGHTWTKPESLCVDAKPFIGIYPQFCTMNSGVLAMVWGRCSYGVGAAVAFSVDGCGKNWTDMTPLPFDSGMNDIVEVEPDVLLLSGAKCLGEKWELQVVKAQIQRL